MAKVITGWVVLDTSQCRENGTWFPVYFTKKATRELTVCPFSFKGKKINYGDMKAKKVKVIL